MKIRSTFLSLAVLATAFTGTVLASGTANASSGGGCTTATAGGASVKACISASGANLEPDGYILANSGCAEAYLEIIDETSGTVNAVIDYSCSLGHKGPVAYGGINGHSYYSKLFLVTASGSTIVSASSPVEKFAD